MATCKKCNKEFKGHRSNSNNFCSRDCYYESMRQTKISLCETCGGEKKSWRKYKYCSMKCRNEGKEWRENQSMAKLGKEAWNKGKPAPWARYELLQTPEAREKSRLAKIGKPSPFKGKARPELRAENNPMWKGGTGTKRHQAMGQIEYKLWRKAVFERDNYTCQMCGEKGGYLQADHKLSWADFPELRYEVSNGRTLCMGCHYLVTFGKEMPQNIQWGKFI